MSGLTNIDWLRNLEIILVCRPEENVKSRLPSNPIFITSFFFALNLFGQTLSIFHMLSHFIYGHFSLGSRFSGAGCPYPAVTMPQSDSILQVKGCRLWKMGSRPLGWIMPPHFAAGDPHDHRLKGISPSSTSGFVGVNSTHGFISESSKGIHSSMSYLLFIKKLTYVHIRKEDIWLILSCTLLLKLVPTLLSNCMLLIYRQGNLLGGPKLRLPDGSGKAKGISLFQKEMVNGLVIC